MKVSQWTAFLYLLNESNGFSSFAMSRRWAQRQHHQTPSNAARRQEICLYSSEDSAFDNYNPIRDESSEMPDYIASYIDNTMRTDDSDENDETTTTTITYSHMIGIPMDECHELTLELESVQRAILYHCPLLVHACIVPAVTRMPLLYVSAPPQTKNVASVTRKLHRVVERVVREQLYVKEAPPTAIVDPNDNQDEIMGGINKDGYKPLLVSFENLEIDGAGNQVLSTVAIKDQGSERLISFVNTLKQEIEALGWKVMFPPDDHASKFRPRIPFMRLPENFTSLLDPLEEGQEDWMRTSDQGGNGISPIFWCQWWEDTMARNVRLREVSVYPRQPTSSNRDNLGEQAFYIPHETTPLPTGNDALTKAEARHEAYNKERMEKAQGRIMDEDENGKRNDDTSLLDPQVKRERARLESIYAENDTMDDTVIRNDVKKEIEESLQAIDVNSVEDHTSEPSTVDGSSSEKDKDEVTQQQIDNWTKERIRKTVEARAFVQAQKSNLNKDMPKIEDNEIFQKYKNNTLVDKTAGNAAMPSAKKIPDYPSREHFYGIWRMITPPTGFPEDTGDNTKSDNIILRVDGTIAGGPSLDQQTNQKAAGGTWRMVKGNDDDTTKLRIRLVIPPKKERILVMEGEVTRFLSGTEIPLSKSTFGIPELEAAAQNKDADMEDLMHCGGPVWIEDAVTGKNREEIGTFSLMKLHSPLEPGKYSITIPRPVRNQD